MKKQVQTAPQSIESERAILGSILFDNQAFDFAIEAGITAESFCSFGHRLTFTRIAELAERGRVVDLVTLSETLAKVGELEKAGGAGYLAALTDGIPIGGNEGMKEYCRIVREKAAFRRTIGIAETIRVKAIEQAADPFDVIEEAQTMLFALGETRDRVGFHSAKEIIVQELQHIEDTFRRGIKGEGVVSGFEKLDSLVGGFRNGELIIIAARPSVGKTAFLLNMAAELGIRAEKAIGIFSFEMEKRALILRMLCSEARVDSHRLRNGFASDADWRAISNAMAKVAGAPIFIDDAGESSVIELRAKARRLRTEKRIAALGVDYIQLVAGKGDTGAERVGFVSRNLKAAAKELKVPVIALSQLNRDVEKRQNPKPMLADLRESGAIEQDADVVIFLYPADAKDEAERLSTVRKIGVTVAKNRNGPTGDLELAYLGRYVQFVEPQMVESVLNFRTPYAEDREL